MFLKYMNDLVVPLYEDLFDYDTYQILLDCLYNNNDYGKFGWLLLIVPLLLLALFYRVWDPMRRQRLMWLITIIIIPLIGFITTMSIVNYNNCIILQLNSQQVLLAESLIIQISLYSALYFLIISLIYTLIVKRFSINNSHNPF